MSNIDELMQRAAACAASSDLGGEVDAYREADDLGDADAAILSMSTWLGPTVTAKLRGGPSGDDTGLPDGGLAMEN